MFPETVQTFPFQIFPEEGVARVVWPINFCALNASSSKTVKTSHLKIDKHIPSDSPDMTLKITTPIL